MTQTRSYTVVLHPEADGGFSARVPAFPEIVARGEDETHTLHAAREEIERSISRRRGLGEHVPAGDATFVRNVTVPVVPS